MDLVAPDFFALLGEVDDPIIIPSLFIAVLNLIPQEVIEDCRVEVIKPIKLPGPRF